MYLKKRLTSSLLLQYPDPEKPYQLETDALGIAIGAVLRIFTPQGYKPIAYKSRMLSVLEKNYLIYHKELFAIVHTLKKQCCYLEDVQFLTILMDHKLLKFFKTQSKLNRRQTGLMELLGNFNFTLAYHPG